MTGHIDAVLASGEITATYRRYLKSLLAVRDPRLDKALDEAIRSTPMLDKGPYLEATPPYAPSTTLRDLVAEGVLSPGFANLTSAALPLDRPLYVHQEQAVRKVREGRNVVVATGTGSGKTESFLIPILDALVREHEAGTLDSGVRALLLYPMNALANDQMKRLRQLLAEFPRITFGRYTGDTETDPRRARESFEDLNIGEPMLPNELLSREEMRRTPPHILLTNYAMLEYLLLRPQDFELFGDATSWRFLVVDEAHVYDGTQGAEIAMLLRRVRDRVAPDRQIQCIATSATVGGDSDPGAVTRFATNLFGQPFEWRADDRSRQDLVTAHRVKAPTDPLWGPLSSRDYLAIAESADPAGAVLAAAVERGFESDDAGSALLHERTLSTLRDVLSSGPQSFGVVAARVFGDDPDREPALSALVDLASSLRCPDGTTPLSARYHLFLRATEGAFTCLSKHGPHVQLARHEQCPDCSAPVFELGSCKRCGGVHLAGTIVPDDGILRFRPRKGRESATWLVLGSDDASVDEDEEALVDEELEMDGDLARLCTACGALHEGTSGTCSAPGCGSSDLREVRRLTRRGEEIAGCLVCGARGAGTVRGLESGAEASGAVITTSLYQNLASGSPEEQLAVPQRKLLMFSDSRQAAAYFAPYLEDSYGRVQRRRLISQGLLAARSAEEPVGLSDAVHEVRRSAVAARQFTRRATSQEQTREVAPWVMAEILSTDDRQSLEGLGLVSILMDRDPAWSAPPPLRQLGLDEEESWALLQELLRTLRQQGAVSMPDEVPPNHEIFEPRLGPIYVRSTGPEPRRKVLSWLPGKGTNRRVDYLRRVLDTLGADTDPAKLLEGIWGFLTHPNSPVDWLRTATEPGLGALRQLDHELIRIRWVTDAAPVYRCSICRRTSPVSVRGVCPALKCEGKLEEFHPPAIEEESDHYRSLYRSMTPAPLKAMEHTAQWTNREAASIQQRFIRGEVNALSCSTTFELGVDVGELQAVMLRNVPPTTANYLQRAGRAGRRTGSAALVVTYAQRRSHDLTRFATPEVMMTGAVRAPYVPLDNERIDRRHAHSVALAAFFRWYFDQTQTIARTAGDFFLPGDSGGDPPVSLVKSYLTPVPPRVQEGLLRVLPPRVAAALDVEGGAWVDVLVDLLEQVRSELAGDVETLDSLCDEAAAAKKFRLAERYKQVVATLRRRELLGFLANRNVLPKYGFPVDSVELRTAFSQAEHQVGSKLDLTRNLSQAIYEYAPGATLVAGGQLWTSRGLYRLPGRDLEEFHYRVCDQCEGFWQGLVSVDPTCPHCGAISLKGSRTLTIPEYGFVAERETQRPGRRPPERSWHGAVHVLRLSEEARESKLDLHGGAIKVSVGPRGRMIAIADGKMGLGFWVCEWCGHGAPAAEHMRKPPAHKHLIKNQECRGPADRLDLAHVYETDLLSLDFTTTRIDDQAAWKSVLYAIVEAACETLEISRDDIGATLAPSGATTWALVLFDTVPGGAGNVLMVEEHLERVLRGALRRVQRCECGPETSCYGCLRSFGNQRDHEVLSRGKAAALLASLLGPAAKSKESSAQPDDLEAEDLPPEWRAGWALADDDERRLLAGLVEHHIPPPTIGLETTEGIPLSLAWPAEQVCGSSGLDPEEIHQLEQQGWSVVDADPSALVEALHQSRTLP